MTTGAIRLAKLQSNRHRQQTNTHLFTFQMPLLSLNQQCQSTKGKISTFHGLAGRLLTLFCPIKAPGYLAGRVAKHLVSAI